MKSTISTEQDILADKIGTRNAKVGIVGLGYVGLPLAIEFAKAGFPVTGIDVQQSKIEELNAGRSYIQDVPTVTLRPYVDSGAFRATMDFSVIAELDTVNIAVPTPPAQDEGPGHELHHGRC
jgi:UDP-N-acetyl-D-glucosamine dehydrogenase